MVDVYGSNTSEALARHNTELDGINAEVDAIEAEQIVQNDELTDHESRLTALEGAEVGGGGIVYPYTPGDAVSEGYQVSDRGWLMHANAATTNPAAPTVLALPFWDPWELPVPPPAGAVSPVPASVTYAGMSLFLGEVLLVTGAQVWCETTEAVDPNMQYQAELHIGRTTPTHRVAKGPVFTAPTADWYDIPFDGIVALANETVEVFLVSSTTSGTIPTLISSGALAGDSARSGWFSVTDFNSIVQGDDAFAVQVRYMRLTLDPDWDPLGYFGRML